MQLTRLVYDLAARALAPPRPGLLGQVQGQLLQLRLQLRPSPLRCDAAAKGQTIYYTI